MNKIAGEQAEQENTILSVKDYEKSRLMAILEGVSARIIFGFTTGAFLTGFLKYIGADDKLCGQIAAIPVLAGIIQFVSPLLLEKIHRRKPLITWFNALHRLLLVLLVFVPLLPVSMNSRLLIVAGLYFVSYLMVNMVAPATTTMIISLVPQGMRGRYFGNREIFMIFISSILNIVMGRVLDLFEMQNKVYEGYIVMYGVALLAMLLNLFSYLKMKEPPHVASQWDISFKELFTVPLKEKSFRKIVILFFIWGISTNFSAPFLSVYMVSQLHLSYTFITLCGLVNSLVYVLTVRLWGKTADKKSFTYIAMISLILLGFSRLGWFLVAKESYLMHSGLILLHVIGGLSWAGVNISLLNIPYENTPDEARTVYLGFNAALSGLVGFMSSMFASWMVGKMENYRGLLLGMEITQFQMIFLISGMLMVVAGLYIRFAILKTRTSEKQNS
jgi:Na+/melibiose symporter-like transporter